MRTILALSLAALILSSCSSELKSFQVLSSLPSRHGGMVSMEWKEGDKVEYKLYKISSQLPVETKQYSPAPAAFTEFKKDWASLAMADWKNMYKEKYDTSPSSRSWSASGFQNSKKVGSFGVTSYPDKADPKKETDEYKNSRLQQLLLSVERLVGENVFSAKL